jgi:hypothetical protein
MKTVYGLTTPSCPDPPVGNVRLVEYMNRLNNILTQLNTSLNKKIAQDRLELLKISIQTNYSSVRQNAVVDWDGHR